MLVGPGSVLMLEAWLAAAVSSESACAAVAVLSRWVLSVCGSDVCVDAVLRFLLVVGWKRFISWFFGVFYLTGR